MNIKIFIFESLLCGIKLVFLILLRKLFDVFKKKKSKILLFKEEDHKREKKKCIMLCLSKSETFL